MIYVMNEMAEDIDVLSVSLRCRRCGNQWSAQLGIDGVVPEHILGCYRCLARESAERQKTSRQEANDGR